MAYILVINSGSSSLKFKLFNLDSKVIISGTFDSIGSKKSFLEYSIYTDSIINDKIMVNISNHRNAFSYLLKILGKINISKNDIIGVGHRVVHGGNFKDTVEINSFNLEEIRNLSSLAPLHNPNNVLGIEESQKIFGSRNFACFDTVFFSDLPKVSSLYPIQGYDMIKRYGFHGLSYSYLYKYIKEKYNYNNLIICHIGNGASIAAIKDGKVIDTTMGMSPLEGLIMGTRSGDIDPEIIFYLQREHGLSYEEVSNILNKKSGLFALSQTNDMRIIWDNVKDIYKNNIFEEPKNEYDLAYKKYIKSLIKYISYFKTEIGNVDAIVFSGGIGEKAYYVRESVCQYFDDMSINDSNNKNNYELISDINSKIKVLKILTNEEKWIFNEVKKRI